MKRTIATTTLVLVVATGCEITSSQRFVDPPNGGATTSTSVTTGFVGTGVTTTGGIGGGPTGSYDKTVVVATRPPPPISGGTLLVIAKGKKAAVADPDRDQVSIVDLDAIAVTSTIPLQKGDQPGRLVEDAAGLLHVVLRGTGELATLDPVAASVQARLPVCANPRGVAYDGATNQLHVACVDGELVTLSATTGALVRQLHLDHDLRDVVVDGPRLLVSRFREAELLVVESDGHVSGRLHPPGTHGTSIMGEALTFSPAVAWRTVAAPGGGAIMAFQEEQTSEVHIQPGGYGGFGCGGVVRTAVSLLRADGGNWTIGNVPGAVLGVDVAINQDGSRVNLASAGATPGSNQFVLPATVAVIPPSVDAGMPPDQGCGSGAFEDPGAAPINVEGQAVAVAFDPTGRLLVQTRTPSLVIGDHEVTLLGNVIEDTGHELFHLATAGGLACASCHPEGREDGHVWNFEQIGQRRTQSIGGGISGTEPFHWGGDMKDFTELAHDVMSGRMSGPSLRDDHIQALSDWIDAIPAWKSPPPVDPVAVERGRVLFASPDVGCASCHSGAKMTNNATVDVGTGAAFQVPSLIGVAYRAPFLHQGCAPTLDDRFGPCGGGDRHGKTSSLTTSQRADLVAYLGTL